MSLPISPALAGRKEAAMVILGLTGSIGMGKSTVAKMLRRLGVPLYDSDAEVHRLLGCGGRAVPLVGAAFAGAVRDGAVDRTALGARVFGRREELAKLESILHPMVRDVEARLTRRWAAQRVPLVVFDIPLLFETGSDARCDATLVVSAPRFLQELRVLARPGMTREKLAGVLARQMSDAEKRRRADFVVPSGLGRALTFRRLRRIVAQLKKRRGLKWPPGRHGGGRATATKIHGRQGNRPRYRNHRARSVGRPSDC
jgi:dephospho-CoA kinase